MNIDHNKKDGGCTFYQNALLLAVGNCLKLFNFVSSLPLMLAMHSGKMYMMPSCSLHIYGQIQVAVWGLQGTSTLLRKILWQAYKQNSDVIVVQESLTACLKHN